MEYQINHNRNDIRQRDLSAVKLLFVFLKSFSEFEIINPLANIWKIKLLLSQGA